MADQISDSPILNLLSTMNLAGIEASSLDAQSLMLVRMAALVAVDAPPVSYMLNLQMAGEVDVDAEAVEGMLAAIAPIVGSAGSLLPRARWCARSDSRSAWQSSTRAELRPPVASPLRGREEETLRLRYAPLQGVVCLHPAAPRGLGLRAGLASSPSR